MWLLWFWCDSICLPVTRLHNYYCHYYVVTVLVPHCCSVGTIIILLALSQNIKGVSCHMQHSIIINCYRQSALFTIIWFRSASGYTRESFCTFATHDGKPGLQITTRSTSYWTPIASRTKCSFCQAVAFCSRPSAASCKAIIIIWD